MTKQHGVRPHPFRLTMPRAAHLLWILALGLLLLAVLTFWSHAVAAGETGGEMDCIVAAGEPGAVIAKVVRRDQPDVLVMGALSRSDVGRDVVGRTAGRTLDDVDCDVLVVKPASVSSTRRVKAKGKAVSRAKRNSSRPVSNSVPAIVG